MKTGSVVNLQRLKYAFSYIFQDCFSLSIVLAFSLHFWFKELATLTCNDNPQKGQTHVHLDYIF